MTISAALKAQIDDDIANQHVFVASKDYCPYCRRAKQILKENGVEDAKIIELNVIEDGADIQDYLQTVTGQRTVPNIFIKGKHIGGADDLGKLNSAGKLKGLL